MREPDERSHLSRLGRPDYPVEQTSIALLIEDVENRVRVMCRLMELWRVHGTGSAQKMVDCDDDQTAISVFYEYIDQQMDKLSEIKEELRGIECDVTLREHYKGEDTVISINALRDWKDV